MKAFRQDELCRRGTCTLAPGQLRRPGGREVAPGDTVTRTIPTAASTRVAWMGITTQVNGVPVSGLLRSDRGGPEAPMRTTRCRKGPPGERGSSSPGSGTGPTPDPAPAASSTRPRSSSGACGKVLRNPPQACDADPLPQCPDNPRRPVPPSRRESGRRPSLPSSGRSETRKCRTGRRTCYARRSRSDCPGSSAASAAAMEAQRLPRPA